MNTLKISVINELHKLWSRKKSKVFLGILGIFPLILAFVYFYTKSSLGIILINGSEFPLSVLDKLMVFIMPLFSLIITIDIFCEETPELSLMKPVERNKAYAAKIFAAGAFSFAGLAVTFIVSNIAYVIILTIQNGIGDFPAAFVLATATYLMAFISMVFLSIAAAFFSQIFKNGTGTMAFIIVAFILLKFGGLILPGVNMVSPVRHMVWYASNQMISFGSLISFISMLSYSIIFLSTGLYIFEKKEY